MTPEHPEPQIELLITVAAVLLRGDWRTAKLQLATGGDMAESPELVVIAFCLRCVTRAMHCQCVLADVEAASNQLDAAAARLGPASSEPARHRRVAHLRWTTSLLVQRERADLGALRRIVERLSRGQRELVYAVVEHMTWIEFDPWTVRIHPEDRELTGLDGGAYARYRSGNRLDICVRATNLRQFGNAWTGSVTERTWHRMDGYPAIRERALRVLAEEPHTRGGADLPVRLGRLRAWSYARDWFRDTAA
ncbi:MAG: hypothetical protein ACRDRK_15550 [Pseudonocardia sp.]